MIMHEIEIRLPGSGFKALKPGDQLWDPPKNTPSFLEAGTQNFQRQLIYWSWAEAEGCTVLTFRGEKKHLYYRRENWGSGKARTCFLFPLKDELCPQRHRSRLHYTRRKTKLKRSISFFFPFLKQNSRFSMSSFPSIHCWIQAAHVEHSDPLHLPLR